MNEVIPILFLELTTRIEKCKLFLQTQSRLFNLRARLALRTFQLDVLFQNGTVYSPSSEHFSRWG